MPIAMFIARRKDTCKSSLEYSGKLHLVGAICIESVIYIQ